MQLAFTTSASLFVVSLVLSLLMKGPLRSLLKRQNLLVENYRGSSLPAGAGLLITLAFLGSVLASPFLGGSFRLPELLDSELLYPLMIVVLGLSFLGLVDDFVGDKRFKGFRGHFGQLMRGRLTSGTLKATGGVIVAALATSFVSWSFSEWLLNVLVVSLFANGFNLLDLRPGRALKVFLILGGIMFLFSVESSIWLFWGIFLGAALVLLWADLREESTLGDAGSNTLGGIIGMTLIYNFDLAATVVALVGLVFMHWYGEKRSITKLISRVPLLRLVDGWGRTYRE